MSLVKLLPIIGMATPLALAISILFLFLLYTIVIRIREMLISHNKNIEETTVFIKQEIDQLNSDVFAIKKVLSKAKASNPELLE